MATVVPLNGDVLVPGRRAEDVVELLRDLLAEAERGEIVALACSYVSPAHQVTVDWAFAGATNGLMLVGAAARLLYRLNKGQD